MAARSDASGGLVGRLKSAVVQRVIGTIALVVTTLIIGAVRMGLMHVGGGSPDDSMLASKNEMTAGAPVAAGAKPADSVTKPAAGDALDLDQPAEDPDADGGTAPVAAAAAAKRPGGNRLASNSSSGGAAVTAVTPDAPKRATQMAHLDEHVTYQYNALGRRDPFTSLIGGEFVGADMGGDAPPDPGGMRIVGIVWGATDQFAMVEDVRGNSYVLRKGDKLQNGTVEALRRDALVINVTADGQSQQVTIPFVRKGDDNVR